MAVRHQNADLELARLSVRHHAIVTHEQASAAALTRHQVAARVRSGRLWPCYPGVYSVGHPPITAKARYLAAVRACGSGARASGLAAAYLLSLIPGPEPPPEVTAPRQRRPRGVISHQSRLVGSRHTAVVDQVPVSRPGVALVETAGRLCDSVLSRAIHKAVVNGLTEQSMHVALDDRPNYPGRRRLAAIFFGDDPLILSELERMFGELLSSAELPPPLANRHIEGRFVDCRWPESRLTVELLGFRFHNSRATWETDHARRREARARGDNFRTFTFEDVTRHPDATVSEVRSLLIEHS